MRILFATAAALLLLTGAAFAQANTIIDPETLPENKAIDQQYRNALKKLPEDTGSNDPWRIMRSTDQNDPKAKPISSKKQASGRNIKTN